MGLNVNKILLTPSAYGFSNEGPAGLFDGTTGLLNLQTSQDADYYPPPSGFSKLPHIGTFLNAQVYTGGLTADEITNSNIQAIFGYYPAYYSQELTAANRTQAYNPSIFAFSYFERPREDPSNLTPTVLQVKVLAEENTVPSITGIKIIGSVSSFNNINTGVFQSMFADPPGSTLSQPTNQGAVMFKVWRDFRWNLKNATPPYKPQLSLSGGQVEFYASTSNSSGLQHPLDYSQCQTGYAKSYNGFNNAQISNLLFSPEFMCNPISTDWDSSVLANDPTKAEYTLDFKIQKLNEQAFSPDGIMVKGIVTTY
jgi:hypothetical protein